MKTTGMHHLASRAPSASVSLTRDAHDDLTVALSGELDMSSRGLLAPTLCGLAGDGRRVRFDALSVEFIDLAGFRLLLELVHSARCSGFDAWLEPSGAIRRLADLAGLDAWLDNVTRAGTQSPD